jgi:hypothetical protein
MPECCRTVRVTTALWTWGRPARRRRFFSTIACLNLATVTDGASRKRVNSLRHCCAAFVRRYRSPMSYRSLVFLTFVLVGCAAPASSSASSDVFDPGKSVEARCVAGSVQRLGTPRRSFAAVARTRITVEAASPSLASRTSTVPRHCSECAQGGSTARAEPGGTACSCR